MMWKVAEPRFDADPVLARALDVLFIFHADHEQNCSATAMRVVGSSHADPYSAARPLVPLSTVLVTGVPTKHVIRMLRRDRVDRERPSLHQSVKSGKGGRLQGFGHRVYKNYDPRAKIIKRTADEVFAITGKNPLLDIALKLEEIALRRRVLHRRAGFIRTSTSTRASSIRRWGSPSRCSLCCSRSPGPPDGWRTGSSCSSRTRKIVRPRQLYTGAERVTTCPWTTADFDPLVPAQMSIFAAGADFDPVGRR